MLSLVLFGPLFFLSLIVISIDSGVMASFDFDTGQARDAAAATSAEAANELISRTLGIIPFLRPPR